MVNDIEKEIKEEIPSEEKEGGFEIMSPEEVERAEAGWEGKQEELKKEGYEKDLQFLEENKERISPPLEPGVLERAKESLDEKWGIEKGAEEAKTEEIFKEYLVTPEEVKSHSLEEKIEGKSETSKEYLEQEYAVKRLKEVKDLLSTYFPEFYKDIYSIKIEYNSGHPELKISHRMEGETHLIKMEIPQAIFRKENFGDLPTDGPLSEGYKEEKYSTPMPRKYTDLFYLTHEYLHALESEIILKNYKGKIPENLKKENLVLGEGFQVSTELILIEKIKEDADKLGLSREDVETLDKFKEMRLKKLEDTGEADEILLYYKMYKEKGGQAIEEFVNSNEVERTLEKVAERQKILEAVKEIYSNVRDLKRRVEKKEVTKDEAITRAIEKARSNFVIAEYLSQYAPEIIDTAFGSRTEEEYITGLEKYRSEVEAKLEAKFPPEKKEIAEEESLEEAPEEIKETEGEGNELT